jgi:predicted Fe-Mo cluster-binding NifX family protein
MKICIPVLEDRGLQSPVSPHFGSAPYFLMIDTDTEACRAIPNGNQHHGHGQCMPLQALQGESVDGIVVGGIGMGALQKLMAAGLSVYRAEHDVAERVLQAFRAGTLQRMKPGMACHGHGHENLK